MDRSGQEGDRRQMIEGNGVPLDVDWERDELLDDYDPHEAMRNDVERGPS